MSQPHRCLGLLSEVAFFHLATEKGFHVFLPLFHDSQSDCIVYIPPHGPVRVQIKTMHKRTDSRCVNGSWSTVKMRRGISNVPYQIGDTDVFAFACGSEWHFERAEDVIHMKRFSVKTPNNDWDLFNADYRILHQQG